MKDGVPSVHVGVGVCPEERAPLVILAISPLPSDDALLVDRISSWTSDMLRKQVDRLTKIDRN